MDHDFLFCVATRRETGFEFSRNRGSERFEILETSTVSNSNFKVQLYRSFFNSQQKLTTKNASADREQSNGAHGYAICGQILNRTNKILKNQRSVQQNLFDLDPETFSLSSSFHSRLSTSSLYLPHLTSHSPLSPRVSFEWCMSSQTSK